MESVSRQEISMDVATQLHTSIQRTPNRAQITAHSTSEDEMFITAVLLVTIFIILSATLSLISMYVSPFGLHLHQKLIE